MYDLEKIEFKNEKRYLSNMYPCEIHFAKSDFLTIPEFINPTGLTYNSSEHLYQALKSDSIAWHHYLLELTPEQTKTASRKKLKTLLADNKNTFLIKSDFHDIKYLIMRYIVFLKFEQNLELRKKLINERGVIEEKNCWGDTYWGTVNGIGENNLGKILMEVRDFYNKEV